MQKKIYFVAPMSKWWPYFMYKEIIDNLEKELAEEYSFVLINSFWWRLKTHIIASHCVISVIPFLFRPLFTSNFFFNPRGNRRYEKRQPWLWKKLLYFAEKNLDFADLVLLPSRFLVDKLKLDKRKDKVSILPNFVDIDLYSPYLRGEAEEIKLLTITNFFYKKKWEWILKLWEVVAWFAKTTDKNIIFSIWWNDDSQIFFSIKEKFDRIIFPDNVKVKRLGFLSKSELRAVMSNNQIFLYWTGLDNFPKILLEAMASWLWLFTNNYESFWYFLPKEFLYDDVKSMMNALSMSNYTSSSQESLNTVANYDKPKIITDLKNLF